MHFNVGLLLISLPYVHSAAFLPGQLQHKPVHLNATMEEYQIPQIVSTTHSQEVQAGRSTAGQLNSSIEHREPAASPEFVDGDASVDHGFARSPWQCAFKLQERDTIRALDVVNDH